MLVPSGLCPIYSLDVTVSLGKYKSNTKSGQTCKGHKLDEPHGNIFLLGHFYEVGDFGVVEVLDDDSVQFYRMEVRGQCDVKGLEHCVVTSSSCHDFEFEWVKCIEASLMVEFQSEGGMCG